MSEECGNEAPRRDLGRPHGGADIWAAVDVHGPSHDMLPRYWSAAPKARPRSAAKRKGTARTIAPEGHAVREAWTDRGPHVPAARAAAASRRRARL